MLLPISDAKLSELGSANKGEIFVGTEMYGNHRPSGYVVIDGGQVIEGQLALGLSGKGAFTADRLRRGGQLLGIKLPQAGLIELELSEPKTSTFNGTLDVGQLLVTTQGAYLGVDWFNGGMKNFALVNLQTWTLQSYASLNTSADIKARAPKWRLVYRHRDQALVLAESAELPAAP